METIMNEINEKNDTLDLNDINDINEESESLGVDEIKPIKKSKIIRMCNLSGATTIKQAKTLLETISQLEEFVMYPKE